MNFCPQCGTETKEADFCPQCGAKVAGTVKNMVNSVSNAASNVKAGLSDNIHEIEKQTSKLNAANTLETSSVARSDNAPIVIQQQVVNKHNTAGISGFTLSIFSLFFSWIPVIGWIAYIAGMILSIIGLFKEPRSLAIAGVVISVVIFIIYMIVGAVFLSL